MPASGSNKTTLRLPPMPKGYRALKVWLAAALRRIGGLSGASVQIDGADSASVGADGTLRFKIEPGGAAASHPFAVSNVSGDTFRVLGGTCEGQAIETQDIDVGSTRPVAILAYPKYTLSIFNSEFVWFSAVKTGADKPVLVSSTSLLSGDVTTITSAGNEGRALIAVIDSDNAITQYAYGNIVGTFTSAGSLDGKMTGSYNKNS